MWQKSACWKISIFPLLWMLELLTSSLGFYFSKYIVHAYITLEIRIAVIAGWCRFNPSNLWRIIQQNKWKNKAEWGILSNRSQVGLGVLIVCWLSNLFQLQPPCFTYLWEKCVFFQITFHAWPQSHNWFLLAVTVKMRSPSNFSPTAVHFSLFKW